MEITKEEYPLNWGYIRDALSFRYEHYRGGEKVTGISETGLREVIKDALARLRMDWPESDWGKPLLEGTPQEVERLKTHIRRAKQRANRQGREDAMRSCGLVKVRGAQGGTYWE